MNGKCFTAEFGSTADAYYGVRAVKFEAPFGDALAGREGTRDWRLDRPLLTD